MPFYYAHLPHIGLPACQMIDRCEIVTVFNEWPSNGLLVLWSMGWGVLSFSEHFVRFAHKIAKCYMCTCCRIFMKNRTTCNWKICSKRTNRLHIFKMMRKFIMCAFQLPIWRTYSISHILRSRFCWNSFHRTYIMACKLIEVIYVSIFVSIETLVQLISHVPVMLSLTPKNRETHGWVVSTVVKAPGHQHPQDWLKNHCIGPISY